MGNQNQNGCSITTNHIGVSNCNLNINRKEEGTFHHGASHRGFLCLNLMKDRATVEEVSLILRMIGMGYKVPPIIYNTVKSMAKLKIEDARRCVLVKRDPNVNTTRMQGAFVKIIDGETIEIHPTCVGGFGADFDGDQMALYAPLSEEAQAQVRTKMITAYGRGGINDQNFELSKEMTIGIFTLTATQKKGQPRDIKTIGEAKEMHIGQPVNYKYKGEAIKTTAGRVVFNSFLPDWYPFVNEDADKKVVNKVLKDIIKKDPNEFASVIDELSKQGFKYSTLYPKSITLDQMEISERLKKLKLDLDRATDISAQNNILTTMEKVLMEDLKKHDNGLYYMVASGGSKGTNQLRQLMVAKGLITDPQKNILPPISKSINDGFTKQEYFDASAGSRSGTIDRALNTSYGGYAYRKFIFVVGNVEADLNIGNCQTRNTLDIKMTKDIFSRMSGRYCYDDKGKLVPVDASMIGSIIRLRSPIFCETRGICRTCYGDLINQLNTKSVGIEACSNVASLSEKIMKCSVGQIEKDGKLYCMEDLWETEC